MYLDDMLSPLVSMPELLVTVLTLEPVHLVMLQVVLEELLCLETPSAVPHPAEVGMRDVHHAMKSHGYVVDGLEATQVARELFTGIALPLVNSYRAFLEIFTAIWTPGNLVDLEMISDAITFEAAAVTPRPLIITGTTGVTGPIIITSAAGVSALTWRRDWMFKTVRGGLDVSSHVNSLL